MDISYIELEEKIDLVDVNARPDLEDESYQAPNIADPRVAIDSATVDDILNEVIEPIPLESEADALPLNPSGKLLKQYLVSEGFSKHHIEVYDNWVLNTIKNNIKTRDLKF